MAVKVQQWIIAWGLKVYQLAGGNPVANQDANLAESFLAGCGCRTQFRQSDHLGRDLPRTFRPNQDPLLPCTVAERVFCQHRSSSLLPF